jgi:hypothetical protein
VSLARYAKRRDDPEGAIVHALEQVGALVIRLDVVDLLVLFRGRLYLLECKAPGGALTRTQCELARRGWPIVVVETPAAAIAAIGARFSA